MAGLPQRADRYLRAPSFESDGQGLRLRVLAWEAQGERVVEWAIDSAGEVTDERSWAISEGDVPEEHRARHRDWIVRIDRDAYLSRVVATFSGRDHVVWEAQATASAPAIHAPNGARGAWVAFHHNLREDRLEADLAKWIAVRFVDDEGNVFEPAASMIDRDRDREGEEQSFEFPTLAVGVDGAVSIFGRGSHRFWRQDLNAAGFAPRVPLGDGAWGCRGRRVAVHALDGGAWITARREKPGIEIAVVEAPQGGAPALRPATVVEPSKAPAVVLHEPARDPAARDGRATLFGDIHQHSAHSDGIGAADEPYLRARYAYGDDFCALTDHESFLGKRIGPSEWKYLESVAERHDDPGSFATLIAYEWTGKMHPGPGHKVVYLPRAGLPVVSRDTHTTGAEIVAAVRELGGLAVPHHVGWTGADEGAHDAHVQPIWEICSCHGCYETFQHELGQRGDLREQMVDAVLRRGLRFGFIASSDGHGLLWHHGVARKRDPFRTGLTAVQATARTRGAILEALRARRCYATSGAKILLDLRANGSPMGSELAAGKVDVEAVVHGTALVRDLELVGPEGVVHRVGGEGPSVTLSHRVALAPAFLYVRARQEDGEMAWSSPVFFGPPSRP